jgi:hypothetical protein
MRQRSPAVIGLCVVNAAFMITSGVVHLHLEQTAYQHVKTIGMSRFPSRYPSTSRRAVPCTGAGEVLGTVRRQRVLFGHDSDA